MVFFCVFAFIVVALAIAIAIAIATAVAVVVVNGFFSPREQKKAEFWIIEGNRSR